jgi:Acetyltransferase (isoleucine patch superfamily)
MEINHFQQETPWEIRKQILDYHATQTMNDIERAIYLGLPNKCRIRENAKIISQENLILGENVWIGEGALLDASGGLEIGANSQIGLGVYIWSHSSHKAAIKGLDTRQHRNAIQRKATKVGSNCFIGGPSLVMPGVTIGDKCIIAPFSVVYEDLPDESVYKPYKEMVEFLKLRKTVEDDIRQLKNEIMDLKRQIAK